jgi:hypothetical protein
LPAKKEVKNMRVGPQPIIARPAWYDRNPSIQVKNYSATEMFPHFITLRWSYTVPSGKKAFLELGDIEVVRAAAATTVGRVKAAITYTPSGGSEVNVIVVEIRTNGVGDRAGKTLGQAFVMSAGDSINAYTEDTSSGGSIDYYLSAKITEFDA